MNPTYEHRRPYDGCDLYRGDALEVLPLLAGQGIVADMVLSLSLIHISEPTRPY